MDMNLLLKHNDVISLFKDWDISIFVKFLDKVSKFKLLGVGRNDKKSKSIEPNDSRVSVAH